jgi:hypothetical protein
LVETARLQIANVGIQRGNHANEPHFAGAVGQGYFGKVVSRQLKVRGLIAWLENRADDGARLSPLNDCVGAFDSHEMPPEQSYLNVDHFNPIITLIAPGEQIEANLQSGI